MTQWKTEELIRQYEEHKREFVGKITFIASLPDFIVPSYLGPAMTMRRVLRWYSTAVVTLDDPEWLFKRAAVTNLGGWMGRPNHLCLIKWNDVAKGDERG